MLSKSRKYISRIDYNQSVNLLQNQLISLDIFCFYYTMIISFFFNKFSSDLLKGQVLKETKVFWKC